MTNNTPALFFLTLAMLLVAGCAHPPSNDVKLSETSSPHSSIGAAAVGTTSANATWSSEPLRVGIGGDSEVSMDTGPDGTVLVCSHGGLLGGSPPRVWASLDWGATFQVQHIPDTEANGDCDVAVQGSAWYLALFQTSHDIHYVATTEIVIAQSGDHGKTWTMQSVPVTNCPDRPWLTVQGNTLSLAYMGLRCSGSIACGLQPQECAGADVVMFTQSKDGGKTWSAPALAYGDETKAGAVFAGRMVDWDNGTSFGIPVQVSPTAQAPHDYVWVKSGDGGKTWSANLVATVPTASRALPSAIHANAGTAFLYTEGSALATRISARFSADGTTWSAPAVVSGAAHFFDNAATPLDGTPVAMPNLASISDPTGHITVAWHEAADQNGNRTWTVHAADLDFNGSILRQGIVAPPTYGMYGGEFIDAAKDASGGVLIAYLRAGKGCADSTSGRNQLCVDLLTEQGAP